MYIIWSTYFALFWYLCR